METQGGSVQVDSENMHSTFGLGWHDGLRTGFLAESTFDGTKVSLGDEIIPFVLPTDVFDTSYYLWGRGIGLRRQIGDGDALIFRRLHVGKFEHAVCEYSESRRSDCGVFLSPSSRREIQIQFLQSGFGTADFDSVAGVDADSRSEFRGVSRRWIPAALRGD